MRIITVIPLKKSALGGDLTYFTAKDIPPGSIVSIPIRRRKVLGLVVSSGSVISAKSDIKGMDFNLKKIIEAKEKSIFRGEYIDAALEAGKYFASPKSNAISALIPSIFREKYDELAKISMNEIGEASRETHRNIKAEKLILQAPIEDRMHSYKIIIRGSFARKTSVFMVLPTERDIKTFYASLSHGIEQFTYSIHGGFNSKKTLQIYESIMTQAHPVLILGTAPYLSIPRGDIKTIILEHESTGNYKMIGRPHIDLRIFTEIFASKINAKLILGDTLLSLETLGRSEMDGLVAMHPPSYRINFKGKIQIISRKDRTFKVLSDESIYEIETAMKESKNVFIFTLRKGLATSTICRDCKETVSCEQCSAPLVLYLPAMNENEKKKAVFICNRCRKKISADAVCAKCGGWNLMPLGIGSDTVYVEIKKIFPKAKVLLLDKNIARNQKEAEEIVRKFEENPGSILIGTELALFYLNRMVPVSIVASFDALWSIPNFKMSERVIQIMISILSKTSGKFVIQTRNENDPGILAIKNNNLSSFVRDELSERKNLAYPPYKRFIKVRHLGDKEKMSHARKALADVFKKYNPEIYNGFTTKIESQYATNALIKLDIKKWSLPELSVNSDIDEELLDKLCSLPLAYDVSVDPDDLL